MFSCLLRGIPAERAPRVALAGSVAVARGIEAVAGVAAGLKWPNDVRIDRKKVCGMIGELAAPGDYVVLGIGVNVGHDEGELPAELGATSIRIASGKTPRRDELCVAILRELDALVGSDGFMDEYRRRCETIGSEVRVEMHDAKVEGTATDVRDDGALMVDGWAVVAGDVIHLRDA
jgi:BirA family transcriptional regulator, biotin operon repressor / biotin---[acetyl-CoA-carboxylase] ligase